MAKKNVGLIEQHAEKVVLAAAVLFLLAVVFLYLVRTPNRLEFDGKERTPGQIDLVIRERAERLAASLRRTRPEPKDVIPPPKWKGQLVERFGPEGGILETTEGLDDMSLVSVPPGREVPRLKSKPSRTRRKGIAVATVVAPNAPDVKYIRTLAVPQRDANAPGEQDRDAEQDEAFEQDINLVILESRFDVADQRERIAKAIHQDASSTEVVFADVQVQRQERLGAGWSEWEDVETFRAERPPSPPKLKLVDETALTSESIRQFGEYRDKLLAQRVQEELLLPQGPTRRNGVTAYRAAGDKSTRSGALTSGGRSRSTADRTRSNDRKAFRSNRVKDYSMQKAIAQKVGRSTKTEKVTKKSGEKKEKDKALKFSSVAEAAAFITKTLAEAEQALNDGQEEQARALAQSVVDAHAVKPGGSPAQIRRAKDIVASRGGIGLKGVDGETVETDRYQPFRAFDVYGEPGRTYRYRMRVGILNPCCLAVSKLEDPNDATAPILYGEWSTASEPIDIERDTYFYVVGADLHGEGLRVDVFKWYQDGWIRETFVVAPGDEIGSPRAAQVTIGGQKYFDEVDFATGAVAVDVTPKAPYQDVLRRGQGYTLREGSETPLLIYMDEDGELQEQFASADKDDARYKELVAATRGPREKKVKVEDKKAKAKKSSARKSSKSRRSRSSRSSRYSSRRSSGSRSGGSSRRGSSRRR